MFGFKLINGQALKEIQETMTFYKRTLEDLGWINMSIDDVIQDVMIGEGFKKMLRRCKLYYYRNPLAGLWISLTTDFVFGEGISEPKAVDENVQEIISKFWNDQDNKISLTSYQAQILLSNKLQYEGNLFFVLFTDEIGDVRVRIMNTEEVDDIIKDTEDRMRPAWYKIKESERKYNFTNDNYEMSMAKIKYCPDWNNLTPEESNVPQNKIMEDAVIFHVKINCDINDKFGIPELFRGIDWIKANKEASEDLATLVRSLSTLAWKKKIKGGPAQVNSIKAALQAKTDFTNIGPGAGSMQIENQGIETTPIDIKTGGASINEVSIRQTKLMVCAASRIFEHYFGDPSCGNLATTCYSEDTEYLSETGWKKYTQFQNEKVAVFIPETGEIKYEKVELVIYDFKGDMIHFKGRGVDCLVTPNHRMFVRYSPHNIYDGWKDKEQYGFVMAENLLEETRRIRFKNSSFLNTDAEMKSISLDGKELDGFLFAKFLGIFISEGSIYKNSGGNYLIEIGQKEDSPFCDDIDTILKTLFANVGEKQYDGMRHWYFSNKELFDWLEINVGKGAGNKKLPDLVWEMSLGQKKHLFDCMMSGDGHMEITSGYYSTSSSQLLDDFQRLCYEIGVSCHIRHSRTKEGCLPEYIAQIRKDCDEIEICSDRNIQLLEYSGKIWCFNTSSGVFITRRNGKVAIQGNTSMELPMIKKFKGFQKIWTDIYDAILVYQIIKKVEIGLIKGGQINYDKKTRRNILFTEFDRNIDIDFPDIISKDLKIVAEALEIGKRNNLISDDSAARIFLLTANQNNVEEEINKIDFTRVHVTPGFGFGKQPIIEESKLKKEIKLEEDITLPDRKKAIRFAKKGNYVLQRMNGYKKILLGHLKTMQKDIQKSMDAKGEQGKVVGIIKNLKEHIDKFTQGMNAAAIEYFPIAIDIGSKFTQAYIDEAKIRESIYEASNRSNSLLIDSLAWNKKYIEESLAPDIEKTLIERMRTTYNTTDDFYKTINDSISSFEYRVGAQYGGAFWNVEERAVKEAGKGSGLMANFAGADDSHTCQGCDEAMAGNPWPIDEIPEPGSHECRGNCRHAIQII